MQTRFHALRDEHRELLAALEVLRIAAEAVGEAPPEQVRALVARAVEFLTGELLPHADAEERGLYPVVARLMGAPGSTQTMAEDHLEVARLTVELEVLQAELGGTTLAPAAAQELRRILYGLYALVAAHLGKEEKVFFPLVEERLSGIEASRMLRAMQEFERYSRNVRAVMQQAG
jgi:iron-sulfur cluster repair protein YtfE (RIC family)